MNAKASSNGLQKRRKSLPTRQRIKQHEFEELIAAMRFELQLSFWQGISLSLAMFVLSICVALLLK